MSKKLNQINNTKKVKKTEYWYCERCKHDSTGKSMCPCPRGSCEAEHVGTITTTTEITIKPKYLSETSDAIATPLGDVEELYCRECKADTGHHVVNSEWTCVHCGTSKNK